MSHPGDKKRLGRALLSLALLAASSGFAATKNSPVPDREMLRMLEFLRDMEMLRQMEMFRDMHHLESAREPIKTTAPQKAAPSKKKETMK